ncbi:MAG TPA: hypothetical protein VFK82_08480, partial [Burkholderiaceae bacterium]|nr:hypothetical protein [Burkholderiaceae bacterium]
VLVALDLGLLVALQWSARHPRRMRGIVMMEGFFLPMDVGWSALPMSSRLMMRLARWPWLAERAIVGDNTAVARFLRSGVLRQLSADEIARYVEPWRDPAQRRKVWLHGINAGVLVPPSRGKGDAVELIDRAARALERSATPKLLLTASPGMVVTPTTVDRARERLSNLKVVNIGAGKHFLPEDQPAAIAQEVGAFLRTLAPRHSSCEPPPESPATCRAVAGHR